MIVYILYEMDKQFTDEKTVVEVHSDIETAESACTQYNVDFVDMLHCVEEYEVID